MASSSSSSLLQTMIKEGEHRNWADLPPELTSLILQRLGAVEIVEKAEKVCRSWRSVCKDPSMWRKIEMRSLDPWQHKYHEKICCHAVDRSQGRLGNLIGIKVSMCNLITSKGLAEAVVKLPLLEELEVSDCSFIGYCSSLGDTLKVVGQSCPNLTTLKENCVGYSHSRDKSDYVALAIAETMPGLRHLQLFGNKLTEAGLNAILDSCPNLEHLDLRNCFNVNLAGDLEKRCVERIKVVRRPNEPIHDYPFDATVNLAEDGYPDDFSDGSIPEDDYSHHSLSEILDFELQYFYD
uniref:F-box domain-containing protein n=1 Tax=Brassica oleracea var. oleracea TaxID=109376 RepID=A0A0D3C8B0_BRAOL